MIRSIRKTRLLKIVSIMMAILFINEILFPTVALALTGGPSQPEVESFAPIEATDMVDLFTGDFKYNIPLMDIDGYPININYNANITMDQEASWVGLGWNLNPGVINRSMRGLPDEFCGDNVTKEFNFKEDETYGLKIYLRPEVFSKSIDLKLGYVLSYSTKNKFSVETQVGITPTLAKLGSSQLNVGLNFSSSTNGDFSFTPKVSFSTDIYEKDKNNELTGNKRTLGCGIGFPINSVAGLQSMQLGLSASRSTFNTETGRSTGVQGSGDLSASLSFVPNTYTPQISIPIENSSAEVNLNLGTDIMVVDAFCGIGGYYLKQKVRENTIVKPAYGYIYNNIGNRNTMALLDFNREKDVTYHPEIKNLPITNQTYDIYTVLGQGVSGTFRSYSNDVGFVFDDFNFNTSSSFNAGAEIAATNVVKGGGDVTVTSVLTNSNLWQNMNTYVPNYYATPKYNLLYEPTNFKMVGEANIESDLSFIQNTAFPYASRLDLQNKFFGLDVVLNDQFTNNNTHPSQQYRKHRQKRNQFIQSLNGFEASNCGLEKNIKSYKINNTTTANSNQTYIFINRTAPIPSANTLLHPSEITINKTDGSRYVYGIPAYVSKQVEASFSVKNESTPPLDGLTTYTAKQDSKSNDEGFDNFYSKTILPPYAHSYLLTGVLSPEYVDLTGDGPSDDDLGNYTKFNYTSMFTETGLYYKWRTPFEEGKVSYNEGTRYKTDDAKGSYIYGEKDIWFLHSIETKNYIVDFIFSDRCDAYGVKGDAGGINNVNLQKKLKEIRLYSKKDKLYSQNPTPIKVVHFEYDYSLCIGVPNNDHNTNTENPINQLGKLTLKKIYFTYGNSQRGKLNPYTFKYCNENATYNPDYKAKACDRWGFYKPETNKQLGPNSMNSYEFPYVDQREFDPSDPLSNILPEHKHYADVYSSVWSLTEIITPSGATIKMKYESDDYAYVQDKRAMQMMKIAGFCKDEPTTIPSILNYLYTTPSDQNKYIIIEVPEAVSNKNELIEKYFAGVTQLYLKCLVDLDIGLQEYISCYATINDYGLISGTNNYIWVKISDFDREDNPVSVAACRYCMENDKWIITGGTPPGSNPDVLEVIKTIAGLNILSDLIKTFKGPFNTAIDKGIAKTFIPSKSWVRLDNPNFKKLGGGSRISEIRISDNWNISTGSADSNKEYGQIYDYTMTENNRKISSGVAAYEPMVGGDEIPHRTAVFYKTSGGFLKPDNFGYLENPMGESFFPAPNVGYRKVTVKNIQDININKHATGKVVHEFYTAKDFPVINNSVTDLAAVPLKSGFLDDMFSPETYNKMTTSQGYLFETNDMHGKPKSQKVYAEGKDDAPISGVEYYYKQAGSRLTNVVNTIDKNGSKSKNLVGFDYDVINDFRECSTTAIQAGDQINASFFFAGIFPLIIPPVWPTYSKNTTQFRSAVTTKVINYYGILQDVVKFDQSSRVKTSNMLYDAETGEVLLTKTQNSFNDSLFSFTYPAHWMYKGMEPSFENTGFTLHGNHSITNGIINVSSDLASSANLNISARELFSSGDEIFCYYYPAGPNPILFLKKAWVLDVNQNSISLIDQLGKKIPSGSITYLKVIRSGRKNQHALPVATILSRKDPTNYLKTGDMKDAGILESEAIEYDNTRKIYCGDKQFDCKLETTQEYKDFIRLLNYLLATNKFVSSPYPNSNSLTKIIQPINLLSPEYYSSNNNNQGLFTELLKSKFQLQSGDKIFITGLYDDGTSSMIGNYGMTSYSPNPSFFLITKDINNLNSNLISIKNDIATNNNYYTNISNSILFTISYSIANYQNTSVFPKFSNIRYFTNFGERSLQGQECRNFNSFDWDNSKFLIKTNNLIYSDKFNITFCGNFNNDNLYLVKVIQVPSYTYCGIGAGDTVNPFTNGILANWQPRTTYKYLAQRKRTEDANKTTNLKIDGDYLSFNPFWKYTLANSKWSKNTNDNNWVFTNTVTIKDRNGSEVENKNALGIYSAALYGFTGNLVTAVSANTQHKEIVSEGFEDPNNTTPDCYRHLNFTFTSYATSANDASPDIAHTGKYSLKIDNNSGNPIFYTHVTTNPTAHTIKVNEPDKETRWSNEILETNDETITPEFIMDSNDCKARFSPDSSKDYIISYWIHAENSIASKSSALLVPSIIGIDITMNLLSVGKPIEGWQRIEGIIHFGSLSMGNFTLSFIRNTNKTVYMDDLRILPFNSSMKAYVYDDVTKRLMAELDENNYASFYEYDEDGSLVRVKKESEKGVFTIKEVRKNLQK
ncbi:MAG: hypothetical protein NTZ33_14600 [Bacteroidetes bacterium]|nr:hypothetical protein [Bacteroidota bacterium]